MQWLCISFKSRGRECFYLQHIRGIDGEPYYLCFKACVHFSKILKIATTGENIDYHWIFNFFHFELCALPLLHQFDISVEKLPVIFAVYNLFVD